MRRLRMWGLVLLPLLLLGACGGDDDAAVTTSTTEASTTSSSATDSSSPTTTGPSETVVRVYFLRDEKVGPVGRNAVGVETAEAAVRALLDGPGDTEGQLGFTTAIPAGTTLHGVTIEDGTATVDLSGEFGSGGGSLSMTARVAQVVFTLTQFDTVDAVVFELDGAAVEALGGEGLLLDEPQTRSDWEDLAPAILVESPLPFDTVTSPLRLTGTANTFEAVFRIEVTDGDGLIVYDGSAMATSGTGTRGTFDETVDFEPVRNGIGSLIVWEPSARDGSQTNLVEIPITLP